MAVFKEIFILQSKKCELIKNIVYSAFDQSIDINLIETQIKEIDFKINQLLKS